MHLKKILVSATLFFALSAHADYETINFFGSVGAGFGMGGSHDSSITVDNGIITKVTDQFYNYGSGLKLDLGMQYFMMDDVSLQTSFSYSMGGSFKVTQQFGDTKYSITQKRNLFGLKVSVVPRFEALDLIDVYTGVGIGFYWNSRPFEKVIDRPQGRLEQKGKITSAPTIGFTGQLGTDYPLSDKVTLFGELAFEQLRFNLNKYIIKESNIPGEEPGTKYYSKDDSNTDNLTPEKVSGSNFQIRVGIRFAIM